LFVTNWSLRKLGPDNVLTLFEAFYTGNQSAMEKNGVVEVDEELFFGDDFAL